jgi:hypothetical protein
MSSHRLALRPLAVALAALALASPTAMAAPHHSVSEEQVLASRGTGAPTTAPAYSPASRGFGGARDALAKQDAPAATTNSSPDWGAFAAGAAGAALLIAVFAFGVPARGARVRTAR